MDTNSNSTDKYQIYSDCLKNIFEKIKKNISKKHPFYNELMTACKEINEKIANDKGKEQNADKYFVYMKMAMEGENIKIIEGVLEYMQKLIKEDLLLGQSEDLSDAKKEMKEKYDSEKHSGHFQLKRKLIDTIVDSIVRLFNISDENVWLHSVKILYTIYRNGNTKIHCDSLLKIFKICVRIYLSSRTVVNLDTTKSSLNHMIMYLFNKMEQNNAILMARESTFFEEKETLGICNTVSSYSTANKNSIITQNSFDNFSTYSGFKSYNTNIIYRNPVDDMIGKVLKTMVDDVCLFTAKIDLLERSENVISIPLKQVPPKPDELLINDCYELLSNPLIENERGLLSGNFGWCLICRNKADFYCKESRYPVCSYECKLKIQQEDEKIIKYQNGELINQDDVALLFYYDAVSIFKSLCKLVNTSVSSTNEAFNSKAKVISLELILSILDKPGTIFLTQKDFLKIVKDDLMEGLLKNCVSDDIHLFSLSLNVFFKIWNHFRENLKQQISVFIETVCLKILDSGNSTINHKLCVMDNFYKLSGSPRFFVELYVNYDCDIEEKDLLHRVVTSLSKIAQGKYVKSEHIFTPQQEYTLRSKALDILTMMIRTILMYAQDQVGWNTNRFEEEVNANSNINSSNINTIHPEEQTEEQISMLDVTTQNDNLKEKLDNNRKMKSEISQAVVKFNLKIKSGLLFLKKLGLVNKEDKDQEAKDIANFLKNSYGLKKENIGELLGDHNEVALKTLHYYTQSFDFRNMNIVDSIRLYLSGFQLPGEGQKIERIMEQFASKYYQDNEGLYATADCAYYVAFSIIMLQTSIHNPNVKKKMTLEEFSNMLKGMNGGKDLELTYLADIYQRIQTKSISLIEHEEAKDKMEGSKDVKRRQDLFKKETERMYQEGTEKLKKGGNKQYLKICEIEHITPMMESIWTAYLAMYSLALEDSDDEGLNSLSIEGFANCIKLCGLLNLELEKSALLNSFCGLTNLLQGKEMKDKHITCVRSILLLANADAKFLKGCWRNVLELISKIDYYHMISSGSKAELETFFNEIKVKKRGSQYVDRDIMIEKNNMDKIAREISQDDYEIIFSKTVLLDQDSIIDFVKSLCDISREELDKDAPRIFSLQKLVEVAEFNMNRVRIVWANIWNIISQHLTEVGSNVSPVIAEKAVDSLRQLAKKFLQKDEISVYQFQKDFLKPFENILINNINVYRTKEYVITCIANLVLAEAPSIKSGWRIIFNIFQLAAEDSSKDIIRKTFDTIVKVFNNHFSQVKENFPELAHCLKKFAVNYPEEVISLYYYSFKQLDDVNQILALLTSLASILSDSRENIRKIVSDKLFSLIHKLVNGEKPMKSLEDFWKQIFKIIIKPVIDDLVTNKLASTLEIVLFEVCDLFEKYYNSMEFLLNDFLVEISSISASENEPIALSGSEALKYFINKEHIPKNTEFWEVVCLTLADVFNKTRQTELLDLDMKNFNDPAHHQKYQDLVFKNIVFCILQHNLIELCEYIIDNHMNEMRIHDLNVLLDCLRDSFELAYRFNIQFNLRKLISFHFMSDLNQVAALFKQQQDGTALFYKILNKIYDSDVYDDLVKISCKKKLLIISHSILKQFIDRINYQEEEYATQGQYLIIENERLMNNMVPVIIDHIIPSLLKIDFISEVEYLDDFTKIFIDIIPCSIFEVRIKIKEILTIIFSKMKTLSTNLLKNENK